MGEWDACVKEWIVDSGYCYAGAIISPEDGEMFAAAGETEDPWSEVWADDHEEDILQEDGVTTKKIMIKESATLAACFEESRPVGVWLAGEKWQYVQPVTDMPLNDVDYKVCMLAKLNKGCFLVRTAAGYTVLALYDKDKDQDKTTAVQTALRFAEYLAEAGM